jgi:hypothetical protein
MNPPFQGQGWVNSRGGDPDPERLAAELISKSPAARAQNDKHQNVTAQSDQKRDVQEQKGKWKSTSYRRN